MKYKYYYNNQLVRTSENIYKFAVITGDGGVLSCSRTHDLAVKSMSSNTSNARHNLEFLTALLIAIESNKKEFSFKNKGYSTEKFFKKEEHSMNLHNDYYKTNFTNVIDFIKERIKDCVEWLNKIKIVELEQR